MLQSKTSSLSNLPLFQSETIFSRKIISERKKYMDLYSATFWSFAVQWTAKITSYQPQLKLLA